jgi:RNA polymerase sigma-54 factor
MAQNPVLEEVRQEPVDGDGAREREAEQKESGDKEKLQFDDEKYEVLKKIDDEWREYFAQTSPYRRYTKEDEERRAFLETTVTYDESLQEHLVNQMSLAAANDDERKLGEMLIGNLDDSGYLKASIEEISINADVPVEEVERVLKIVQTFEPYGVGARNLQECLIIQLRNTDRGDSLAARILEENFEFLGKKKYQEIARLHRVSVQDVQEAVKQISHLTLRPGRLYGATATQYIVPDITLTRDNGDFRITINDERIPHLRISNFYRKMMEGEDTSPEVKEYVKEKIHSGEWLIKNIHQRQQTLHNITKEIVARQSKFLSPDGGKLEPLTMHQIAEAVKLHESTISRAIAGKYIDTPHGIYPLKFFFTTAIETTGGGNTSAHEVKATLREFIDKEDALKPLSDEQLVQMINDKGMKIARRTVAKYRKELNILPSHLRKQY